MFRFRFAYWLGRSIYLWRCKILYKVSFSIVGYFFTVGDYNVVIGLLNWSFELLHRQSLKVFFLRFYISVGLLREKISQFSYIIWLFSQAFIGLETIIYYLCLELLYLPGWKEHCTILSMYLVLDYPCWNVSNRKQTEQSLIWVLSDFFPFEMISGFWTEVLMSSKSDVRLD